MRNMYLVSFAGISLLAFQASAQTSSPLDPIYACASIETDNERLACYDQAVERTQQSEKEGDFRTVTRDEAYEMQEESFGLSLKSITGFKLPNFGGKADERVQRNDEGEITDLTLDISNISSDGFGKVRVSFANGQEWVQIDTKEVRWSRKSPPQSATIQFGSFGSFFVTLDNHQRFRAKREK